MADKLERIYTVPLGKAYDVARNKRAGRAVKILRAFAGKHMKTDIEDVILSMALNEYIWERSIQKPPRRVKVRFIREDGKVRAYLADEKIEAPKKEEKKTEEKKGEEKKKEEKPEEKKEDKKTEELKKEQVKTAEEALAGKVAKTEMADEKEKIERAEKKKFSHGKEIASETG